MSVATRLKPIRTLCETPFIVALVLSRLSGIAVADDAPMKGPDKCKIFYLPLNMESFGPVTESKIELQAAVVITDRVDSAYSLIPLVSPKGAKIPKNDFDFSQIRIKISCGSLSAPILIGVQKKVFWAGRVQRLKRNLVNKVITDIDKVARTMKSERYPGIWGEPVPSSIPFMGTTTPKK
ncbi:MAG: hypothetical protein ACXWQO_13160 [Bdellovibrionota bacterium]